MDKEKEYIACNLCGSANFRQYLRKFDQPIVKCLRCGLVYVNPRLTEAALFKRYDEEYLNKEYLPAFGATPDSFSLEAALHRYNLYFDILNTVALSGRKILDIGAAAGFFIKAANHLGWDAEGVELSEAAAAYGRNILGVRIQTGKFGKIDLPPSSFDAVVMLDTLEHLQDPLGDLVKVRTILKTDGLLLLNVPDLRSLSRLFLGRNWAVFSPLEHLFYFRRHTLAALLRRAGFQVIGIRNFSWFNLEYTHDRNSRRGRTWKKRLARWEKMPLRKKIETYERKEIIRLIERSNGARRPIISETIPLDIPVSRPIRFRRRLIAVAKWVLRGDQLVALAVPQTAEQPRKLTARPRI